MDPAPEPKDDGLPEDEPPGEGEDICPACLTPHGPLAHFCGRCGAPVSSFASMMPFEKIFAEGYVYRQAAESPRKFIVVAGIWLIFIPMAVEGVLLLPKGGWRGLKGWNEFDESLGYLVNAVVALGLLAISAVIILRTTCAYFRGKAIRKQEAAEG